MEEMEFSGRIAIVSDLPENRGEDQGSEQWEVTLHADGLRTLRARCRMTDHPPVFRDVIQSVDAQFHPRDAFARIVVEGRLRGSGWYTFTDTTAECEALTATEGRVSQRMPITRAIRGFGTHALQSDAWLVARYDYAKGPGVQRFLGNLMTTTEHRGATGPVFMTTNSSLEYVGRRMVEVPAGAFDCHCLRFLGTSHDYPPYELCVTADGHFHFIHAKLQGPKAQRFDLVDFSGPSGC